MKKTFIITILLVFLVNLLSAQQLTIKTIESKLITDQGVDFVGELKDNLAEIYAFSNWDNQGIIYVKGNIYKLSNLNFNVASNSFESRINRNKIFSYHNSSIDSIQINDHFFKKIRNTFYQVLFENSEHQFLKKYDIKIKPGTFNRLDGSTGKSKEELDYKYLVKFSEDYKMVELSKKDILDLLNKEEDKEILEDFVKQAGLSYRKEEDIVKIIEFIDKNPKLTI